jgi:predicted MFS family arabinose efflux permease
LSSRLWLDVSPLRDSGPYRRLWAGDLVAACGSQFASVALPYQVYRLTGSSLQVGLIGLAVLGPLLLGSLAAGAIADAFDRRTLLLASQAASGACCVALALLTAAGRPPLALLYVLAAILAFASSIESPVRNAVIPSLVGAERITSAAALTQIVDQTSQIAGPALAGLLLAALGIAATYAAAAVAYCLAMLVAFGLPGLPPSHGTAAPGWAAVREGFRFARQQPALLGTFVIDLNAMVFGMPRALFPALAANTFHVGPRGLGLLYGAPAAGALLAAVFSGWAPRVRRQGAAVFASVIAWGAAIAVFGLVPGDRFWLALLLLAAAGAADVVSAVFRNTIMLQVTPDALRGRMSALHIAVVTSGPRVGDVEAGVVASATSVQFSVVSGGLVCIAGAGIVRLLLPALWRYCRPLPGAPPPVPDQSSRDAT